MRLTRFSHESRALRKQNNERGRDGKVPFRLTSWMLKIVWEDFLPLWIVA